MDLMTLCVDVEGEWTQADNRRRAMEDRRPLRPHMNRAWGRKTELRIEDWPCMKFADRPCSSFDFGTLAQLCTSLWGDGIASGSE
jgi:hypothetical protein